ncbi:MAG: glycosyltransferase family 2 protein [Firmicutes bacterium]|nr:glycosyltransferase family 2 protein [Bacillota bacterium]
MGFHEVSIVVPVFNEEAVLPESYQRLCRVMLSVGVQWHLIFVDDGSTDGSAQWLDERAQENEAVTVIHLSRNFGHQAAIAAGLAAAPGDAVVLIDADLQDPPELIEQFVRIWQQDHADVVYGVRQRRRGETLAKRGTAAVFYRLLAKLSDTPLPVDSGDFRLLSRRVVDILKQMPTSALYLRGMVAWMGFQQIGVPYVRAERSAGTTHYTWRRMVRLAVDAITLFSTAPLRWGIYLGSFVGLLGFMGAA